MNTQVNLQSNSRARQSGGQHGGILLALISLFLLALISLFLALSLSARSYGRTLGLGSRFGSGTIVTEERTVGDFDRIEVLGEGTVYLTQGQAAAVRVETDDNLVDRVLTRLKGRTLALSYDSGPFGLHLRPTNSYVYHVTVVDLAAIEITGSAGVLIDQVAADRVELINTGSGTIEIADLSAGEVSVEITGSGVVDLSGRVDTQQISILGSGIFEGRDLEGKIVDVHCKGSSSATVWATEALSLSLEGDGTIEYYGDVVPDIESGSDKVQAFGNR